jgi:hypothetical protein
MTRSEELFEQYCARLGYNCVKIPTGSDRSPDYSVRAGDCDVIVEIKELSANDEDRRVTRELRERAWASCYGGRPGSRVFEHIHEAAGQLAKFRGKGRPCLVLFYDNIVVDGERPAIPNPLSSAFIDFEPPGRRMARVSNSLRRSGSGTSGGRAIGGGDAGRSAGATGEDGQKGEIPIWPSLSASKRPAGTVLLQQFFVPGSLTLLRSVRSRTERKTSPAALGSALGAAASSGAERYAPCALAPSARAPLCGHSKRARRIAESSALRGKRVRGLWRLDRASPRRRLATAARARAQVKRSRSAPRSPKRAGGVVPEDRGRSSSVEAASRRLSPRAGSRPTPILVGGQLRARGSQLARLEDRRQADPAGTGCARPARRRTAPGRQLLRDPWARPCGIWYSCFSAEAPLSFSGW